MRKMQNKMAKKKKNMFIDLPASCFGGMLHLK